MITKVNNILAPMLLEVEVYTEVFEYQLARAPQLQREGDPADLQIR